MMAPTTPHAAVFQAWFSSKPLARARRAISQAPTKHPNAMPTPCGENCNGPMPILGMTFQPIFQPIMGVPACRGLPSYWADHRRYAVAAVGGPLPDLHAVDRMRPRRR